uniref:DH domain-containing protein n=1 Tax=Macrostomum lignano TaxID=282301 RepID=A0A1I8IQ57_9PLAT
YANFGFGQVRVHPNETAGSLTLLYGIGKLELIPVSLTAEPEPYQFFVNLLEPQESSSPGNIIERTADSITVPYAVWANPLSFLTVRRDSVNASQLVMQSFVFEQETLLLKGLDPGSWTPPQLCPDPPKSGMKLAASLSASSGNQQEAERRSLENRRRQFRHSRNSTISSNSQQALTGTAKSNGGNIKVDDGTDLSESPHLKVLHDSLTGLASRLEYQQAQQQQQQQAQQQQQQQQHRSPLSQRFKPNKVHYQKRAVSEARSIRSAQYQKRAVSESRSIRSAQYQKRAVSEARSIKSAQYQKRAVSETRSIGSVQYQKYQKRAVSEARSIRSAQYQKRAVSEARSIRSAQYQKRAVSEARSIRSAQYQKRAVSEARSIRSAQYQKRAEARSIRSALYQKRAVSEARSIRSALYQKCASPNNTPAASVARGARGLAHAQADRQSLHYQMAVGIPGMRAALSRMFRPVKRRPSLPDFRSCTPVAAGTGNAICKLAQAVIEEDRARSFLVRPAPCGEPLHRDADRVRGRDRRNEKRLSAGVITICSGGNQKAMSSGLKPPAASKPRRNSFTMLFPGARDSEGGEDSRERLAEQLRQCEQSLPRQDNPQLEAVSSDLQAVWQLSVSDLPGNSSGQASGKIVKQQAAIWELCHTELNILRHLKTIIEVYANVLQHLQSSAGLLTDVSTQRLFPCLSAVFQAHYTLWSLHLKPALLAPSSEAASSGRATFNRVSKPSVDYCLSISDCKEYLRLQEKNDAFNEFV